MSVATDLHVEPEPRPKAPRAGMFSRETKQFAVRQAFVTRVATVGQIAAEHGVSIVTLYNWRKAFPDLVPKKAMPAKLMARQLASDRLRVRVKTLTRELRQAHVQLAIDRAFFLRLADEYRALKATLDSIADLASNFETPDRDAD